MGTVVAAPCGSHTPVAFGCRRKIDGSIHRFPVVFAGDQIDSFHTFFNVFVEVIFFCDPVIELGMILVFDLIGM